MLLLLMLAVAVLTITMLGVARNYRRSIQRDREVEMIHRGEQYARAVRRFYKKNGRYPTTIEQLEQTNEIRYLRKRYKDPMSPDGEWKLVHITDIQLKSTGGLAPAGAAGTGTGTGAAAASAFGQTTAGSAFGTNSASQNSLGASSSPSPDSSTNSAFSNTGTNSAFGGTGSNASGIGTGANAAGADANNPAGLGGSGNSASPVLGGGPILGVVSKNKDQGIHSFGEKTKYNEWFFIYDPSQDTGQGLIIGPYNPNMFMGSASTGLNNSNKTSSGTGTGTTSSPTSGTATSTPTTPTSNTTPQ
jgi:type II secretory pathway pseudopilin PulG